MAHSATCSGCPECNPAMQAILTMDSRALSRLNIERTAQRMRALGQNPNTMGQMRTTAAVCSCGKHIASETPEQRAARLTGEDRTTAQMPRAAAESPEARRVQALDVYGRLSERLTTTNLKAMRLLEAAFPGLGEQYSQQAAPAMPSMTDRIRANARTPSTAAPKTARGFSNPPAEPAVQYAPVKVRTMTDRILAGRKK